MKIRHVIFAAALSLLPALAHAEAKLADFSLADRIKAKIAAGQPLDIYVSYHDVSNEFAPFMKAGVQRAATSDKVNAQFIGPVGADADGQISEIETLMSKMDGLAISSVSTDALAPLIDKVIAAGIPVVTFNTDNPESKRLAFAGQDLVQSGREAGKLMAKVLGGKGKVMITTIDAAAQWSLDREKGAREALKAEPGIEVVSTLMLNFIVMYLMQALLSGPWKDPVTGWTNSPSILRAAEFPVFWKGTRLHLGVLVAFLAVGVVGVIMKRTTLGLSMKIVGENPRAARHAGLDVTRVTLAAALLSGALAGLAGAGEIGGIQFQVIASISSGYGYAGIVVAMLARLSAAGIIPAALFIAAITTGADEMSRQTGVPFFIADAMQGICLIAVLVAMTLSRYQIRFRTSPERRATP